MYIKHNNGSTKEKLTSETPKIFKSLTAEPPASIIQSNKLRQYLLSNRKI